MIIEKLVMFSLNLRSCWYYSLPIIAVDHIPNNQKTVGLTTTGFGASLLILMSEGTGFLVAKTKMVPTVVGSGGILW